MSYVSKAEGKTMSDKEKTDSGSHISWIETALAACRMPMSAVMCPRCDKAAVSGEWNLLNSKSRETAVDLHCAACDAHESLRITLPDDALPCHPMDRFPLVAEAMEKEAEAFAVRVQQHVKAMPAAAFATHPLWDEANWSASTYQWHPTSDAPPIMGLVFENVEAGLEIFREAERQMHHEDQFDEIRISIIEGAVPGQENRPGYSVHLCADPDALCTHATLEEFVVDPNIVPFLGQWNRHYPIPGTPLLLPRFKQEFDTHKEFMLAPTVRRASGKLYMKPELGIIKKAIVFRKLSDITSPDDIDAAAALLPQLITPPG
jgi:hypothetical protein